MATYESFQLPHGPYGDRSKLQLLQVEVLKLQEGQTTTDKTDFVAKIRHARLATMLAYLFADLIDQEPSLRSYKRRDIAPMNDEALTETWQELHRRKFYLENERVVLGNFDEAVAELAELFQPIVSSLDDYLPDIDDVHRVVGTHFTTPLIYLFSNPPAVVERIWNLFSFNTPYGRSQAFYSLLRQLSANNDPDRSSPAKSDVTLEKLVSTFLGKTPFEKFLLTEVPIRWDVKDRFSHTHILGGTGAGKTTLMEWMIYKDLMYDLFLKKPCSLVIIDPHSHLIRTLSHLNLPLGDRLIIIDPRDMEHPPAVNIFAVNKERFAKYDAATREQMTAAVISTFDYFFTGLVGVELTPKQGILFRYLTRFLLSFPETMTPGRNATILDMIRIVDDPTPYLKAIEKLPGTLREFMLDFVDPKKTTWRDTKQEIRYRLQSVLENPILSRFFTSEETKLDLFTLMNEGAVILIDTAEEFLKDGSAIFGRLWISLILQAVMERAVLDAKKRTPTFLYIDEAYSYFDQNIDSLLTDARKFSCGCILAHHHLDQASEGLRSSLASNTGIKFVSGVSAKDARAMASEMRTTPEFIETQPRYQFATYVRGVTPHAVPVEVSPSPLSKPAAKMSPAEYQERIAANRRRVSFGLEGPRRMPPPSSPQSPDEDISKKW